MKSFELLSKIKDIVVKKLFEIDDIEIQKILKDSNKNTNFEKAINFFHNLQEKREKAHESQFKKKLNFRKSYDNSVELTKFTSAEGLDDTQHETNNCSPVENKSNDQPKLNTTIEYKFIDGESTHNLLIKNLLQSVPQEDNNGKIFDCNIKENKLDDCHSSIRKKVCLQLYNIIKLAVSLFFKF